MVLDEGRIVRIILPFCLSIRWTEKFIFRLNLTPQEPFSRRKAVCSSYSWTEVQIAVCCTEWQVWLRPLPQRVCSGWRLCSVYALRCFLFRCCEIIFAGLLDEAPNCVPKAESWVPLLDKLNNEIERRDISKRANHISCLIAYIRYSRRN